MNILINSAVELFVSLNNYIMINKKTQEKYIGCPVSFLWHFGFMPIV